MELFENKHAPLAYILRPTTFDEIVGQQHLVAKNAPLRKLIEAQKLSSIILSGPAGIGKTTLATVISKVSNTKFVQLSATSATVKDIRKIGQLAEENNNTVIVFLDEIHRSTKVLEDVLLPFIENGSIVLIGATTENVFFSIHSPLISRSQIFILEPLQLKDLLRLILKSVDYYRKSGKELEVDPDAAEYIARVSCGDGRKAISLIEMTVEILKDNHITLEIIKTIAPSKYMIYSDDSKYNYASWYQGAIQASDPNTAVYVLAAWLESGEDPRYIARRLMVSASEDCFSNPFAAMVAHSAYISACEIGRPECDIILSHATIVAAQSERNKTACNAIHEAVKDVREGLDIQVPKEMRDMHYPGAEKLGHGAYKDGAEQSAYVGINKKYI